jgi:uncharacterized protein (DUF488 family)
LGVSADYRIKLQNDEDYRLLLNERYPKILLDNEKAVQNLATAVCRIPTVLLCRETDPKYCHRSVLAEELSSISGLPVVHLR